jgi:hypothetical protein
MGDVVTSSDVIACLATTDAAVARLEAWQSDPRRADVVPAVMGHTSRVVVSVSLEEVEDTCRSTEHALGDVRKSRTRRVPHIRDWTTPFAAAHVFHFITERDGAIPTWQRFRDACQEPPFADMLWNPARHAIAACSRGGSVDAVQARQAMRWRIGNFYYSFLREQWVHAYLRRHGVPILQHPLADALYAVDGWFDDKILSLFIGNDEFRSERGGRKRPPCDLLAGTRPQRTFIDIALPVKRSFGVVHLPERRLLDPWVVRLLDG